MSPQSNGSALAEEHEDRLNLLAGVAPVSFVPVAEQAAPEGVAPYLQRIMIYSIHGGDVIPSHYYEALRGRYPDECKLADTLHETYCIEKDWGANQVAAALARNLGLPGYLRVNIARALLDFGRLPGITKPEANHMDRYAINYPFSNYLDLDSKRALLEECFDEISAAFERNIQGKILTLGVHTYDHRNPTQHYTERGTVRPQVSLIFRSETFQMHKRMPRGLYDPLYPDQLAESTADRRLTAGISLALERAGIAVSHNYPYFLPDGCLEVRAQVWNYFQFLKRVFETKFPETVGEIAYSSVWDLLLDTNLRSSDSEALRSYIHMFRKPPADMVIFFRKAQRAYTHVSRFYEEHAESLLRSYRRAPDRQTALAVEVRKDLVWRFHDKHTWDPYLGKDGCVGETVERVASLMAQAIAAYFRLDHPQG